MKYSSIYDDITVLTVTHNSSNVIENFLNTLDINFKLVIVDNNSMDNTKIILKTHNRNSISLFFNDKGLGFGSGANIGLKTIKSKFVLLVNPDSIIKTNEISKLISAAKNYKNAAIISPLHRNENGNVHIPARPFFFNLNKKNTLALDNFVGDCSVEHISGAIMLLNKSKLDKVGFFDENFFLYYEDDDLCIRSKKAGFENILVHGAIIDHFGGGSIGPPTMKNQWEKHFHFYFSRCYIQKKYFGTLSSKIMATKIFVNYLFKFFGHLIILQLNKIMKDLACISGATIFLIKGK